MTLLAGGQARTPLAGTRSASSSDGKSHKADARVPGHGSGSLRRGFRAERRVFVEEDQDRDLRPTHHVLNPTARVVTFTAGQGDDNDEVVDTGPHRAGREGERLLKTNRGSILSFGDLPVIRVHLRRADQPGGRPDAIDVVDVDLHAPAAAYHVGEAAADAPVVLELPGVSRLHGPDRLVALRRVEHGH